MTRGKDLDLGLQDMITKKDENNREEGNQVVAFVHMPKAAGTTLHAILANQYSEQPQIGSNGLKTLNELRRMNKEQINRLGVIRGHMNYGVHGLVGRPCLYITMLRNPVDRIISHYYYLQRDPHHPLNRLFRRSGFSLRDFLTKTTDNDNGQTRALAGVANALALFNSERVRFGKCTDAIFEKAMANLNSFAVVGLQERFDESVVLMKRILKWKAPPVYVSQNVGHHSPRRIDVSEDDVGLIRQFNSLDLRLYEYATKLFDERTKAEGFSFRLETQDFLWLKQNYQTCKAVER